MLPTRKLAWIWLFFIVRGLFYVTFVPMWEGFDEWAHYAVIQSVAVTGQPLIPRDEKVSREIQASLELVPIPWQTHGPPGALRQDNYWNLPEAERIARQKQLRSLPAELTRERAEEGERSYETQQAPLYYWLMAPFYRLSETLSLPSRVWLLRFLTLLLGSVAVPVSFFIGYSVIGDIRSGLLTAALVSAFPQLLMTVTHITNDGLAVGMGSLALWSLLRWKDNPKATRLAVAAGIYLGLTMLSKGYFLVLIPPMLLYATVIAKRKRAFWEAAILFEVALGIGGWWYWRNWLLWHSLSGDQVETGSGLPGLDIGKVMDVNWLRAADFTFLSHVWLGNWSFLVVRSWMYRTIGAFFLGALAVLIIRLIRRPKSEFFLFAGIYGLFLAALGFHAMRSFEATGFPGSLGHYLFGIVAVEATLLVAAWGRVTSVLILCLLAMECFGMTFLAIPYYTGFISHASNGNLPAMKIAALQNGGLDRMLSRLTLNKPPFLTSGFAGTQWILFLITNLCLFRMAALAAWRTKWLSTSNKVQNKPAFMRPTPNIQGQ